jgi:hypothetical protein
MAGALFPDLATALQNNETLCATQSKALKDNQYSESNRLQNRLRRNYLSSWSCRTSHLLSIHVSSNLTTQKSVVTILREGLWILLQHSHMLMTTVNHRPAPQLSTPDICEHVKDYIA